MKILLQRMPLPGYTNCHEIIYAIELLLHLLLYWQFTFVKCLTFILQSWIGHFFSSSPFAIRLNPFLIHPRPSLFLFGLLLLLWCFSTLINYYFEVFFSVKVILHFAKRGITFLNILKAWRVEWSKFKTDFSAKPKAVTGADSSSWAEIFTWALFFLLKTVTY